jgi:small subunit ribosomal protein S15
MARMHTKKHGKSKSRKPIGADIKKQEVDRKALDAVIEKYAKQGMSPALIGERLKKEHNVPYIKAYLGKRLVGILKERKLSGSIPADMFDLMKKAVKMHKHLQHNKQDVHNKTILHRIESKINRLSKYYRAQGTLPEKWKYDPREAELLIKGRGG